MLLLLFLLIFIAGFSRAVMDTLQFHYSSSVFRYKEDNKFWDPTLSWLNKYEGKTAPLKRKKLMGIPIPVFLTDGWHFFQALLLTSIFVAIVFYTPVSSYKLLDFLILRGIFGVSFMLFYDKLLKK